MAKFREKIPMWLSMSETMMVNIMVNMTNLNYQDSVIFWKYNFSRLVSDSWPKCVSGRREMEGRLIPVDV